MSAGTEPAPSPLADYTVEPFTHGGITHDVYHRGEGPCVLVAAEIPGITPKVAEFADRLVDLGLSVALPSMFGVAGRAPTTANSLATIARACVSKEFHAMARRDSSPATDWLRALGRELHARHGGPGIGFVGMCFTGGFGLAMMLDDAVVAPVLSQPSLPLGFTAAARSSVGLDDTELAAVAERADRGCAVLGLRFTGDPLVRGERFATLRAALGDNFVGVEIPSPDDTHGIGRAAHSVLTEELVDDPGHPTHAAFTQVCEFLNTALRAD